MARFNCPSLAKSAPHLFCDPHNVLAEDTAHLFFAVTVLEHHLSQFRHMLRRNVVNITPIGADGIAARGVEMCRLVVESHEVVHSAPL